MRPKSLALEKQPWRPAYRSSLLLPISSVNPSHYHSCHHHEHLAQ